MSDGGSAFYSWRGIGQFTRLLEELEVDQLIARTPEVNGKLEVLNANIQKELFNTDSFLAYARRRYASRPAPEFKFITSPSLYRSDEQMSWTGIRTASDADGAARGSSF